jgi:hypothetical protein
MAKNWYNRSNFGEIKGCIIGNPNIAIPANSCVRDTYPTQEGGCENDNYPDQGGWINKSGIGAPCCKPLPFQDESKAPKAYFGKNGCYSNEARGSIGCNIGYNPEYGTMTLYKNNNVIGSVDSCSNCGEYYIKDGYGFCNHLKYDPDSNSCIEDKLVNDSFCGNMVHKNSKRIVLPPSTGKLLGDPMGPKQAGLGPGGLPPPTKQAPLGPGGLPPPTKQAPLGPGGLSPPTKQAPLGPGGLPPQPKKFPLVQLLLIIAIVIFLFFLLKSKKKMVKTLFGKKR